MSLSVQPVLKTSYTERGNEYKESNIGKCVAVAGVAGATVAYGGESVVKGAKKLLSAEVRFYADNFLLHACLVSPICKTCKNN